MILDYQKKINDNIPMITITLKSGQVLTLTEAEYTELGERFLVGLLPPEIPDFPLMVRYQLLRRNKGLFSGGENEEDPDSAY